MTLHMLLLWIKVQLNENILRTNMESYPQKSPFLEEVRQVLRVQHYAIRTEKSYIDWIRRFILFHGKRHPCEMGEAEVATFLTHLSVNRKVAPGTQGQALNALVFLYRKVLNQPMGEIQGIVRARKKERIPVVLTQAEVAGLLSRLEGTHWLVACVLYGSGLRLMECIRLRVKDLDFGRLSITVRSGKGDKDRVVTLARELVTPLKRHLESVKTTHERDLAEGYGVVYLPYALERKYPAAATSWGWQYVFPAKKRSADPRSQIVRRHHMDETTAQKAVKIAVRKAGINRPASCHTLRHSFIYRMYGMPFLQEQKTVATHFIGFWARQVFAPAKPAYTTSM